MNEHVFPIENLGDVPAIVVLAFTQGCISLVVFWIRDEIQVEGRLSCPPSVVAARSIRYLRVVFSTKMDNSDFVC